ncbi:MAG: pectate lyase [Cellvibrionaceae bacterium]|nr:pectate lyase [Cellvibrionaceae bacterium]
MHFNNRAILIAFCVVVFFLSAAKSYALSCQVAASHWVNGYVIYVDVTNDSEFSISSWDIGLEFSQDVGVYGSWSTEIGTSPRLFRAKNAAYNADLAPGETASFGVVGSHAGGFTTPLCYTPEDLVIQEAEPGFCSVEGTIDSNHVGFTGVGFANTDNGLGTQVAWTVNTKFPGAYPVQLLYANGSGSSRGCGDMLVEGLVQGGVDFAPTGAWTTWQNEELIVNLQEGENQLVLEAATGSGLANIDAISISGLGISGVECVPKSPDGYLPQSGNPAQSRYNSSRTQWSSDLADIILSYQFDNGGWPKNESYEVPGSGGNGDGEATFDNGATVAEIVYMAQVYKETGDLKYLDSVHKAMDYILLAQYPSGGWPQFYPLRGNYSDYVTFNDNAMSRVLTVLHNAQQQNEPFDNGVFDDADRERIKTAIDSGVDYILRSQWRQNGELTVWCAQHGVEDYLPKPARAYELESLSGSESVEIVGFLMTQQQTPEIKTAVQAALAWFRSPNTILQDYVYDRSTIEKIIPQEGGRMWYRFYDLENNQGFFSDRDGGKYFDIMEISEERREGYSWGGNYGERLINYANSVGY